MRNPLACLYLGPQSLQPRCNASRRYAPTKRPPALSHAQRWGALALGVVLANNALFLALFPEPGFAGTLCAVLLGAGWFFLTLPWFVGFVAATFAVLTMTILLGSAHLDWFAPLMLVVASGGLATVLHFGRVRSVNRMERLRMERDRAEASSREIEARLHRAQKFESLGIMAAGIAHDFNNLLAVMVGYASLLQLEHQQDAETTAQLQDIIDAGARAERLTAQLSAYAGRGWRNSRTEIVDLSAHARETADLLQGRLISNQARVKFALASGLPAVKADAGQLQQVIMNLILNASQALSDDGGEIVVETGVRTLAEHSLARLDPVMDRTPGEYVYAEVEDNGCGMERAVLERIFDPFFTTKDHGRGLGLAAALGIVGAHGGGIQVESEAGAGAKFRLYLPVAPAAEIAAHKPVVSRSAVGDFQGVTALVIDDEDGVRRVAARALQRMGCEVIEASSGAQGMQALRDAADDIRVCVLDLTMPDMSGEETLVAMKSLCPELPVLLSSGYTQDSVARLLEVPGTAFLKKPYELAVLEQKLKTLSLFSQRACLHLVLHLPAARAAYVV